MRPNPVADLEEQRRVAAAKRGDTRAFEALYRDTVPRVFAAVRRLCASDSEAEDVTQRAYIRAWERLDTYRADGRFGGWLRRIAVRILIDERRSKWHRDVETTSELGLTLEATARRSSVEAIDLERAIRSLPPGSRRVFVLHDIEGMTHAEIAEALGVTAGTTKTQLFRARRALQEWMS